MSQQDRAFMTVFKAVIIFLAALTVVIFILARLIGQKEEASQQRDVLYQQAVQERIKPVGEVNLGKSGEVVVGTAGKTAPPEAAKAAAAAQTPKEIVATTCAACHATGVLGAPKLGDKAAWEPRLAQGFDTLAQHAIRGFKNMPARGGNASLTDDQMKGAVTYMLEKAGLAAPKAAESAQAAPAAPSAGSSGQPAGKAPGAPAASSGPDLHQGKRIYTQTCFACHGSGIAGAPKLGDAAAWKGRIEKGMDTLVKHAVQGFQGSQGVMPPKGGNPSFSDQQVADAVAYMLQQAK